MSVVRRLDLSNLTLPLANSSVSTITTPTLTPTTLRLIDDVLSAPHSEPMEHQYQAGFMPPTINPSLTSDSDSQFDSDDLSRGASPNLSIAGENNSNSSSSWAALRDKTSINDEERKHIRRERNKQAAARCRQRRIEYTNKLARETEELEIGNNELRQTLHTLVQQKSQIEATLKMHSQRCRQSTILS